MWCDMCVQTFSPLDSVSLHTAQQGGGRVWRRPQVGMIAWSSDEETMLLDVCVQIIPPPVARSVKAGKRREVVTKKLHCCCRFKQGKVATMCRACSRFKQSQGRDNVQGKYNHHHRSAASNRVSATSIPAFS